MDKLETSKIYQQKIKQGNYTVIYTSIWHNYDFELWAHIEGYGKVIFVYGGNVDSGIALHYEPLTNEQIEELTGEPQNEN